MAQHTFVIEFEKQRSLLGLLSEHHDGQRFPLTKYLLVQISGWDSRKDTESEPMRYNTGSAKTLPSTPSLALLHLCSHRKRNGWGLQTSCLSD